MAVEARYADVPASCPVALLHQVKSTCAAQARREGIMKARKIIPLALLAVACGSSTNDKGDTSLGGRKGTGGSTGATSATGGTSTIAVTGGTSTGGTSTGGTSTGGSDGATAGSSGNGTISMETANDLRAKACAGWSSE